ncbi:head closure [Mycobacterium phage Cornie]|uniref:Head-to-tail stopper n=1 Tax=Mycobacterium phage Cornie TaxID=2704043 RepID=A0A6G6XJZ7_9CAUD|nr:head closure [Mycobacterium phage Cornie]QIG58387.1 head-to-tail stopper [Mycobacterium phage Cornie]
MTMPLEYGGQTVTFVTVTETGAIGWGGLKETTETTVDVPGCHFRPYTNDETGGQVTVATELWKCTAPPVPAVLNAQPRDKVRVNGALFHIEGPVQPKRDLQGNLHHVTVFCKRQHA